MKKCNTGSTCPISGENICCKSCSKLQTCVDACELALNLTETCSDEVNEVEQTALQRFQAGEIAVIQAMANLLKQRKALEEQEKTVRAKLVEAMDAYGVRSFENDLLKVTYVAATFKTTVDSKTLKKDMPDVYEKYSRTSPIAASVRISLK